MASRDRYVQSEDRWLTREQAYEQEVGADAFERQRRPAKVPWNKRPPADHQVVELFGHEQFLGTPRLSEKEAYREARRGE
jgi:hypothetical protein